MNEHPPAPVVDLTFPHGWQAEILPGRPLILPSRHFVYPLDADEVERGALELLIHPAPRAQPPQGRGPVKGTGFSPYINPSQLPRALAPEGRLSQQSLGDPVLSAASDAQPFLATCVLGFRDSAVPTGLWSCPNPDEICAASGGYAYIISTTTPESFTMIPFRPVLEVRPVRNENLLLFVGHHAILAWGANGQAWQSEKLSDEGLTITAIEGSQLQGLGWNRITDKETPFTLDLRSGLRST